MNMPFWKVVHKEGLKKQNKNPMEKRVTQKRQKGIMGNETKADDTQVKHLYRKLLLEIEKYCEQEFDFEVNDCHCTTAGAFNIILVVLGLRDAMLFDSGRPPVNADESPKNIQALQRFQKAFKTKITTILKKHSPDVTLIPDVEGKFWVYNNRIYEKVIASKKRGDMLGYPCPQPDGNNANSQFSFYFNGDYLMGYTCEKMYVTAQMLVRQLTVQEEFQQVATLLGGIVTLKMIVNGAQFMRTIKTK